MFIAARTSSSRETESPFTRKFIGHELRELRSWPTRVNGSQTWFTKPGSRPALTLGALPQDHPLRAQRTNHNVSPLPAFRRLYHLRISSLIVDGLLNKGSAPPSDFGKAITSFMDGAPHIIAIIRSRPAGSVRLGRGYTVCQTKGILPSAIPP